MKRILKIIGIVVAVLVVILIAIPFFINVNSFRPRIEAETKSNSGSSTPGNLSVAKLSVNNGKLIVGNANSKAKPHVYDQVNIKITNFSATSQFPFSLAAKLPAGGTADISGQAGPINQNDAAKTPFEAKVKVNNMDIVASGFIDPASGIAGQANF